MKKSEYTYFFLYEPGKMTLASLFLFFGLMFFVLALSPVYFFHIFSNSLLFLTLTIYFTITFVLNQPNNVEES